jgi:hypothetical protein
MTDSTRAIIDYAYNDEGSEVRNALYSAIHDKVMAHIESHKKEIAQNLIAPETRMALQPQEAEAEESGEND